MLRSPPAAARSPCMTCRNAGRRVPPQRLAQGLVACTPELALSAVARPIGQVEQPPEMLGAGDQRGATLRPRACPATCHVPSRQRIPTVHTRLAAHSTRVRVMGQGSAGSLTFPATAGILHVAQTPPHSPPPPSQTPCAASRPHHSNAVRHTSCTRTQRCAPGSRRAHTPCSGRHGHARSRSGSQSGDEYRRRAPTSSQWPGGRRNRLLPGTRHVRAATQPQRSAPALTQTQ